MRPHLAFLEVTSDSPTMALKTGKGVGGFLHYIQYRGQDREISEVRDLDGLLNYIAYRDGAVGEGRLFDANGIAGDDDRVALVGHIVRSVDGMKWLPMRPEDNGKWVDHRIAVHRFLFSPEDARGLDLKAVTRAMMDQLARDAGTGGMPPWLAGEHRNTDNPHVHIVLAARRELPDGRFRGLEITPFRLERMKVAGDLEISRQRGEHTLDQDERQPIIDRLTSRGGRGGNTRQHEQLRLDQAPEIRVNPAIQVVNMALAMAHAYHRDAERRAREQSWSTDGSDHDGRQR